MVFPRKSGNKLKEPSLPSLSLACQFPLHPVSPGREKAEICHRTLKRHLGFGKRNTVNKANVVRVSLNIYIYILGPRDIPTLGSMTVATVECNCIKGMQIYGADFRPNTCRVHIYICVCVKQTRLKPATPDGYLASGWFGGSGWPASDFSWPRTPIG